jgi:endoglucanase
MEDFTTALLGVPNPENSLQPFVQSPLGIDSTPNAHLLSSSTAKTFANDEIFQAALPSSEYKMPPGRDVLTGQPEAFAPAAASFAVAPTGFIRQQGNQIVDGQGQPMTFKGIAFGNEVWSNDPIPNNRDHSEIDFQRVKAMGMNSVRLYLNYKWFEDDSKPYQYKETGWQWLDQNITWAKKNGISLVLNMHVPQGGFQSQGEGDALWTSSANQERLMALWTTIADRYRNETAIAGYGLVNEPVVKNNKQQWQTLAQNIANSIRQVDKNHLLLVEQIAGVETPTGTDYNGTPDQKMIKINDSNTAYEFHYYGPFDFTHQELAFGNTKDGGKYPDYNRIENNPSFTWYTATFDNPTLASGQTPWKYVEGVKYKVTDPNIKVAIPALVGAGIGGMVSYDDVVIKEFDPTGKLTNTITTNTNSPTGWNFWSSNGSGKEGVTTAGRADRAALTITGTTADANISNYNTAIITKPGYSYQVSGWMKGENVAANSTAQLRLDFQATTQPIQVRDKAFLASEIKPYVDWGKKNNVPLYLGEFGAASNTFKNNKGGLEWVRDVIDIAAANKIGFNYHAYHEDAFGLYPGYGQVIDPTKVNQPLQQFFTTKLPTIK